MSGMYSSGQIAKAICGRCSSKVSYRALSSDPNVPGLRVCVDCKDELDPYRLAPRQPDAFALMFPRPDRPLNDLPNYFISDDGLEVNLGGPNDEDLII